MNQPKATPAPPPPKSNDARASMPTDAEKLQAALRKIEELQGTITELENNKDIQQTPPPLRRGLCRNLSKTLSTASLATEPEHEEFDDDGQAGSELDMICSPDGVAAVRQ